MPHAGKNSELRETTRLIRRASLALVGVALVAALFVSSAGAAVSWEASLGESGRGSFSLFDGSRSLSKPALALSESRAARKRGSDIVPGRYIVVFKDSVGNLGGLARTQVAQQGGKLGFVYRHALRGYSAALSKGAVEALRNDPRVKYVSPDHRVELLEQATPTGIDRSFATANENLAIDEVDDVRVDADVAVIDTGIDYDHPDLNVVARTYCDGDEEEGAECVDDTGDDTHGHGTHVAGTIGALDNGEGVVGVAPGARLWAVRVLDNGGWESEVAAGVDWVTDHADEIEVANMSLGCTLPEEPEEPCQQPRLYEAITNSTKAGVVYVVAAGNDSIDAKYKFPAYHPDVITVSGLADYDGKPGGEAGPTCIDRGDDDTSYTKSNWGSLVEVAAPAVCIRSTWRNGSYGTITGTSMASPHVAGAAAILASEQSPEDLEDVEAIRDTIVEEGSEDWEDTSGDGDPEPLLDVGDEAAFDPSAVVAVTGEADVLSTDEVRLHGTIHPDGLETEYWFEYGTTTEYGSKAPESPASAGSSEEAIPVEQTLDGLAGHTLYHFRLVAIRGEDTIYGQDREFGTTPPGVSTEAATEVNANDAGLNATINPEGFATTYEFELGLTTSYEYTTSAVELKAGTEAVEVPAVPVSGLEGETTYHFRVVASNFAGTTIGEDETFTTQPADWSVQATPKPHPEAEEGEGVVDVGRSLEGVSCASPSRCVAVGGTRVLLDDSTEVRYHDALHWNGESWASTELPMPEGADPDTANVQGGISCPSSSSCFVLGKVGTAAENNRRGLIEHWDGEQWSAQLLPLPEGGSPEPREPAGISCASPSSCMAIVNYAGLIDIDNVGFFAWDGSEWSIMPQPTLPEGVTGIPSTSPSCPSPTVCMVTINGPSEWSVMWDGESWGSLEEIPAPAELSENEPVVYDGLSCVSADACMAVGQRLDLAAAGGTGYYPTRRISAHWDGDDWNPVSTASPETISELPLPPAPVETVSCSAADDCILFTTIKIGGKWQTLTEHWDGEQWMARSGANPFWPNTPANAVSCVQSRCTAVGSLGVGLFIDGDGMFVARLRTSPSATTEPASEVEGKGATLNATVNPEGLDTTYQFEYVSQPEFEENGYENATAVPVSAKGIGAGTSEVEVNEAIDGLEPDSTYHFRVKATNSAGTSYGEDLTVVSAPRAGAFTLQPAEQLPAGFTVSGGDFLINEHGTAEWWCDGGSTGSGTMEHGEHGVITLELHGCHRGPATCTSSGAESGTIVTHSLAADLVDLPGEKIGIFLDPIASDSFATFSCYFESTIEWTGNVIAEITAPGYNEESEELSVGNFSKYAETADGREAHLESDNGGGGEYEVTLGVGSIALSDFGGKVELSPEDSEIPYLALGLQGGFPASASVLGGEVTLETEKVTVTCTTDVEEEIVWALSGTAEFSSPIAGDVEFTLRNCKGPFGVKCTSSGEEGGTIKTESLPMELGVLPGGGAGLAVDSNGTSGKIMDFKCSFLAHVVVSGEMMGSILDPDGGETGAVLSVEMDVGSNLQATLNGGGLESASLEAGYLGNFGEDVELRE